MPKIQARMIKALLGQEADLSKSLTAKLSVEGFKFKLKQKDNGFQILISDCPWHNLMVKSGKKYSEEIGTTICNVEYSVWASEFSEKIQFTLHTQKCKGSDLCLLDFSK